MIQTLMQHLNPNIKASGQKIKNYASEDFIVLDVITKTELRFLNVSMRRINSIKNGDDR